MARIDAVVLGNGLNALGVVRALGRHGLRSAIVSHSHQGVAARSRFVSRHLVTPGTFEPQAIIKALGIRPKSAALFLTEEADVLDATTRPDAWREQFLNYLYEPALANRLLSKREGDVLAREHGAPVPKTVIVCGPADLPALAALNMPCVLKPVERNEAYSARFQKAYRVDSNERLHSLLTDMLPLGLPLVVQEWIEGADTDIYFNLLYVDREGRLTRSFVGRKTLCWPPQVGGTAACMAAPEHHDELTRISTAFLASMRFRGLIGVEYKRDRRDGRFYLVEPTVYRTDYQHEVADLNGSDWLHAAYLDMRGAEVPASHAYGAGRSWVEMLAARYSRQTAPPVDDPMRGSRHMDAHFRLTDPLPGLVHFTGEVIKRLRPRARAL
jgi:predicted ATP-grasp superfamily ATP-dependent carboligase